MKKKVFLCLFLILCGIKGVSAATVTDQITAKFIGTYHYVDSNGKYGDFEHFTRKSDGKTLYCIEPGTSLSSEIYEGYKDMSIDELANKVGLTKEKLEEISLIAYYGYGYQNHVTIPWLVATQAKIWMALGRDFAFTSHNNHQDPWASKIETPTIITQLYKDIDNLIAKHKKLPSFANQTITLPYKSTVTLTDQNQVLGNFNITESGYTSITKEGNTLKITPTSQNKTGTITLEKANNDWSTSFVVYHHNTGQDLLLPGDLPNTKAILNYKTVSGSIKLIKVDKDTQTCTPTGSASLENAVYGLYTENNSLYRIVSLTNCESTFKDIPIGNYYIKEVTAPLGYKKDETKYPVSITADNIQNTQTVNVTDEVYKTNLIITKYYTKDYKSSTEEGAVFDIIDKKTNKVYQTITTDKNGESSVTLPYGVYIVRQTKGKDLYKLAEDEEVIVNEKSSATTRLSIQNLPYRIKFTIKKKDRDTNSSTPSGMATLNNAVYGLYTLDGQLYRSASIYNGVGQFETVPLGDYYIKEITPPKGYEIDETKYPVHLTMEHLTKEFEITVYESVIKNDLILQKYYEIDNEKIPEENAVFEIIETWSNKVFTTITTDENGYAKVTLPYGTYKINQISGKEYYIKSDPEEITVDKNSDKVQQITLVNKPYLTNIILSKKDQDTDSFTPSGNATLLNAVYGLYKEDDTLYKTITITGEETKIENIPLGKYYIQEITPPKGYEIDETKYPVHLTMEHLTKEFEITVYESVIKNDLILQKYYEIDNEKIPEENAVFEIIETWSNKVFTTITTDENGYAKVTLPYGTYKINQISGKEYYIKSDPEEITVDKNSDKVQQITLVNKPYLTNIILSKKDQDTDSFTPSGNATLLNAVYGLYKEDDTLYKTITITGEETKIENIPLGKYYIQEIAPPEGYELDETKYEIFLNEEYIDQDFYLTVKDEVIKKQITITKYYETIFGTKEESGIIFDIIQNWDQKLFTTIKTDDQGKSTFTLPYGEYTIVQKTGKENYQKITDYFLIIDENSESHITLDFVNKAYKRKIKVTKVDAETKNKIKMKNIAFKIYDTINDIYICPNENCLFKTDEEGSFTTDFLYPSIYELEEIDQNIPGYTINKNKITFEITKSTPEILTIYFPNQRITGEIIIEKIDEQNTPIPNVIFTIYAAKDIFVNNKIIYYQNEEITSLKTDDQGLIHIENLPLGTYYLLETPVSGYLPLNEKIIIQLEYQDSKTSVITKKETIQNQKEVYEVPNTAKYTCEIPSTISYFERKRNEKKNTHPYPIVHK